jgi:hypothetical protein
MYWFRKAIPDDLRRILEGKREEKFSLRTKNPGEAQALHAKRAAEIAEKWARLRGNAQPDHADLFGLAGEFYRDMLAKNERNPGGAAQWLAEIEKYTRAHSSPLTGFYSGMNLFVPGTSRNISPTDPARNVWCRPWLTSTGVGAVLSATGKSSCKNA